MVPATTVKKKSKTQQCKCNVMHMLDLLTVCFPPDSASTAKQSKQQTAESDITTLGVC